MKIISNFKDYYDGLATFDKIDKVFERKQLEHEINFKIECHRTQNLYSMPWTANVGSKIEIRNNYKVWINQFINYHVLGVCGKLYPFMEINGKFFYHMEDLNVYLESQKIETNSWCKKPKNTLQFLTTSELLKSFFVKFNVPIFLLSEIEHKIILKTNVKLLDYQFQKFKDTYQVYQDIETFLGNELAANKDVEDSNVIDVDLAKAKGFDKFSFRKEK